MAEAALELPLASTQRSVKSRLRTYQPHIVADLLSSTQGTSQHEGHRQESTSYSSHAGTLSGSSLWERKQAQRQAKEAVRRAKEEAFLNATQARQRAAQAAKDAAFERDYSSILQGMGLDEGAAQDSDNHIMRETQNVLAHKQKIKERKQSELYNEWNTQVFEKIQGRLQTAVSKRDGREIMRRLKGQMDEYLHTTNTKLGVFRDVIIEDDYNPLKTREHDIKIYTGDIRDPVKRDLLKIEHEKALMGAGSSDNGSTNGKPMLDTKVNGQLHTSQCLASCTLSTLVRWLALAERALVLDTKMWGDLWIHATPYGHLVDNSGNNITLGMSERTEAARRSRIPMDHYTFPICDNRAAADELGRPGKRAVSAGPPGGQRDLYDVVQHTCHLHPEVTGGDRWLEARGKGSAPGPEQRRGRTDLTEILHQTSNPYKDGRSLGDQWLEARGKARALGPEQLRGRVDLTDTIQQRPLAPKQGNKVVGDYWLDAKGKGFAPGPRENVREFLFRADCPPDPPKAKDTRRHQSVMINDKTLHPRV